VLPSGKRFDVLVTGAENGTYPLKMLPYKYLPYPEVKLATVNVQDDTGATPAEGTPEPNTKAYLAGLEVDRQRELIFSSNESIGKNIYR